MDNNLPKIFGAVFLLLMLGLGIYILSEKWEINIDESTCKNIADEKEQGKCFYDLAIIKNDEVFCRKIEEVSDKDRCHYDLAVNNSDLNLCSRAGDSEESCYRKILEEPSNKDLCEEIENRYRKEKCYYHLAVVDNNLELCSKAGNNKNKCNEELTPVVQEEVGEVGYDKCNFGRGWSEPESAAKNCSSKEHIKDCCCCYVHSHIHDLGKIFEDKQVLIEYRPGFSKGCTSPMTVYSSIDGEKWNTILTVSVTQGTWSPKTTYNKTINVSGRFRYIKIYIPRCYNDYSSARVVEDINKKEYINVLSPNGGEKYMTGNYCSIRWQSQGVDKVIIEIINKPGTKEFKEVIANDVTASPGNFMWAIPQDFIINHPFTWKSDKYKIRISPMKYSGDSYVWDVSNNYFSILEEKCTDSDGGKDYYVKGKTTIEDHQFEDKCSRSTLTGKYDAVHEYYCRSSNSLGHVIVKCSHGCSNGECFGELSPPQCIDKDGGQNIYVSSGAFDEYESGQGDGCVKSSGGGSGVSEGPYLREGICKPDPKVGDWVFTNKIIKCPYGCKDGACIESETTTVGECTDPDGGRDYYTKSTVKTKSGISTGSYHDLCFNNGDVLHEWYCGFNNNAEVVKYQCPNGCQDGACIKKEATSGPDLIVSDISWQPAAPTEEDNICFSATIKNIGNEAIENNTMTAWTYINDYHAANTFYGKALSPGKSLTLEVTCSKYGYNVWFRKGKNIIRVEIDPSTVNIVKESREYNNQMEKEFFISSSNSI